MKIIYLLPILYLCGCTYSPLDERQNIVTNYSSDVYKLDTGCSLYYVARKPDGSVWIVRPENSKIKNETQIFPSNK